MAASGGRWIKNGARFIPAGGRIGRYSAVSTFRDYATKLRAESGMMLSAREARDRAARRILGGYRDLAEAREAAAAMEATGNVLFTADGQEGSAEMLRQAIAASKGSCRKGS